MYYQNEAGIYLYFYVEVYYGDYRTVKISNHFYETFDDFFWAYSEDYIRNNIGYSINDTICDKVVGTTSWRASRYRRCRVYDEKTCQKINCTEHNAKHHARMVCDQDGNIYTPDYLIGARREWQADKPRYRYLMRRWKRNGGKKQADGGFRNVRTFQERKWAAAWNDEELAPKARGRRTARTLPCSWDDIHAHSDKCWKTQSKRKYQWKEKPCQVVMSIH